MKRIAVVLVALLAVASCGNGPKSGTVVDRHDEPPYSYWVSGIYVPATCEMIGKIEDCNPGINIPGHEQYVAENWSLKLRPDSGKAGWRDVSETVWNACEVNDYYPSCAG